MTRQLLGLAIVLLPFVVFMGALAGSQAGVGAGLIAFVSIYVAAAIIALGYYVGDL